MNGRRRTVLVVVRLLIIGLVAAAIFESIDDRQSRLYVIIDESASPGAADEWNRIVDEGNDVMIRDAVPVSGLASAVDEILWQVTADEDPTIVIESTGNWASSLAPTVRRLGASGIPLRWHRAQDRPGAPGIVGISAPLIADRGQEIAVVVDIDLGQLEEAEVELLVDGVPARRMAATQDGPLIFRDRPTGTPSVTYSARLRSAESGLPLPQSGRAVVVNVSDMREVWVVSAAESLFARSLVEGRWPVVTVTPQALAGRLDDLEAAGAVVLDNISTRDLSDGVWRRIVDRVDQHGLGLVVLGGPNTYGLGGYRRSMLESVMPLISEPPEDEIPASIVFLVDISGSMDRERGIGSRLAVARQAATEAARLLRPTDRLGLIAFDVESRIVLPLEARGDHVAAIEQAWPGGASGGTSVAPSLQLAVDVLLEDLAETKLIVLITDGFIADADLLEFSGLLEKSEAELIALVIADENDANFQALAGIASDHGGTAVRVEDILELPALTRQEIELQRSAVVIGPSPVREIHGIPGFSADDGWPAVDAYALTRPANGATVSVASQRGDPLIAVKTSGVGRVISIAPGIGAWSSSWMNWDRWPDLAASLVNHAISGYREGADLLVEMQADNSGSIILDTTNRRITGPLELYLQGAADARQLSLELAAPGRLVAKLDSDFSGKYSLFVPDLPEPLHADIIFDASLAVRNEETPLAARWLDEGLIEEFDREKDSVVPAKRDAAQFLVALGLALYLLVMTAEREFPQGLQFARGRARIRGFPFART